MTALDTANTQDIDALLAQADSLMNEMAASLAPAAEDTAGADTASAAGSQRTAGPDQDLAEIVEELNAVTESVDAAAVADVIDGGGASDENPDDAPPDDDPAMPTAAPADWVEEARTSSDAGTARQLPTIPDEQASPSAQADPPGSVEGRSRHLLKSGARVLIGVLAAIDYPFARLGPRIKEIIGIVAIATMMTALGAWFVGPYLVAASGH